MKDIKKYSLLAGLMLFLHGLLLAQFHTPLKENQKVPDNSLGRNLTDPSKTLSFKDLKGKLVILDFWNIHCTVCLKAFPKMNALQKQYGDRIKIVLVTKDKEGEVKALLARLKPDISALSVITDDTVLNQLFPHYGEPHHVWIDQEGIFRFATFDHNATEANINALLSKKQIKIASKQDGVFKENESLFSQAAGKFRNLLKTYSVLLPGLYPYTYGGAVVVQKDSISSLPTLFRGIGLSPIELLKIAFNKEVYGYDPGLFGKSSKMRLIAEVADSANLYLPKDPDRIDQWQADNFLSYEIMVRPTSENDLYHAMQRELNTSLPYTGTIEQRKRHYLALVRTDQEDHIRSQGAGSTSFSDGYLDLRNIPVSQLIRYLNERNTISKLPIIDETGIGYPIDLRISSTTFYNFPELRKEINKMGLDIVSRNGPIPMLVIRDKNNMAP